MIYTIIFGSIAILSLAANAAMFMMLRRIFLDQQAQSQLVGHHRHATTVYKWPGALAAKQLPGMHSLFLQGKEEPAENSCLTMLKK